MRMDRMALLVVLVALAACDAVYLIEPGVEETGTVHEGTITADEIWREADNPHKVTGRLVVAGAGEPTLTLEPGVRVLFARGAELHVGSDSLPGALHAVGTGEDPIELMSQLQYQFRGYWGTVHFAPLAGPSRLEHVTIRDCGGTEDWPHACLRIVGSRDGRPHPVLQDVVIGFSDGYGIVALAGTGFGEGSRGIRFLGIHDYPVRIDAQQVSTLPPDASFTEVGRAALEVRGGRIRQNVTWPKRGLPYLVAGPIRVGGPENPVLTLPAGLEIQFHRDGEMLVGLEEPGGLMAEGTPDDMVVFTTPGKEPRGWRGLIFGSNALPTSRLSQTVIEYGGYPSGYDSVANATFATDIGPIIRNSVIRHSSGCGIVRSGFDGVWTTDFTDPAFGNTFGDNELGPQCTTN